MSQNITWRLCGSKMI